MRLENTVLEDMKGRIELECKEWREKMELMQSEVEEGSKVCGDSEWKQLLGEEPR